MSKVIPMPESQTFDQDFIDESKPITFAPLEWKYFKEELVKQFVDDDFDALKAIRRARYRAMLNNGFKQLKEGRGHFHELIEVEDE